MSPEAEDLQMQNHLGSLGRSLPGRIGVNPFPYKIKGEFGIISLDRIS